MVSSTELLGLAYLATGSGLLLLLREPLRRPGQPGSRGFALAVLGISVWPLSLGLNYFVTDLQVSVALWSARLAAASVVSVGWFLVAYAITRDRPDDRWVVVPALCYLAVEQVLVVTSPMHRLVLKEGTAMAGPVLVPEVGPWFWAQTAANYALISGATALLVVEWYRSTGIRRKQSAVLAVAVVPPIGANLVTILGFAPTVHDLTPFGLIGSGVVLTWALYRASFLDVTPVARNVAMAEMDDAVVTIDDENRLVDCNRAARAQFALDDESLGRPVTALFPTELHDVLRPDSGAGDVGSEATAMLGGTEYHFSLSVSTITEGTDLRARVVVFRDITTLKTREQTLAVREAELDLLRQIFSRVLRHNIRNKLTTIKGNADTLAENADDPAVAERLEAIVGASDDLLDVSENARKLEQIVDSSDETVSHDLSRIATTGVASVRQRFPAVAFTVTGADECQVIAGPGLEAAVRSLVENAASYNDDDDPWVDVTVEDDGDTATLVVSDNGPGIPDTELEALDRSTETQLIHSSGVGLWLVTWVADRAGANLNFETGPEGTSVTVEFETAR